MKQIVMNTAERKEKRKQETRKGRTLGVDESSKKRREVGGTEKGEEEGNDNSRGEKRKDYDGIPQKGECKVR